MPKNGGSQEDPDLSDEIRELRQEFQEYVDITTQYQTNRRVENIQVLIALTVVGGAISLYSRGFLNGELWQSISQSNYWFNIIAVFVIANALFFVLKLITIPLLPVTDSRIMTLVHEEIEPFLYFFAITGILFSVIVWSSAVHLLNLGLARQELNQLSLLALLIPLLLAILYAESYRITSTMQRTRPFILQMNTLTDELVRTGRINAEMQSKVMRDLVRIMTPMPAIVILLRVIEDFALSLQLISEETAQSFSEIQKSLLNVFGFMFSPMVAGSFIEPQQDLVRILIETRNSDGELPKHEGEELRQRINNLWNKSVHGTLSEEDLEELSRYLEQLKEQSEEDSEETGGSEGS